MRKVKTSRLYSIPDDSDKTSEGDHDFRSPHTVCTPTPSGETDVVDSTNTLGYELCDKTSTYSSGDADQTGQNASNSGNSESLVDGQTSIDESGSC